MKEKIKKELIYKIMIFEERERVMGFIFEKRELRGISEQSPLVSGNQANTIYLVYSPPFQTLQFLNKIGLRVCKTIEASKVFNMG